MMNQIGNRALYRGSSAPSGADPSVRAGILALTLVNIAIGSSSIDIGEILRVLTGGEGAGHNRMIIVDIRLPMR
jgi:hypothetical protein